MGKKIDHPCILHDNQYCRIRIFNYHLDLLKENLKEAADPVVSVVKQVGYRIETTFNLNVNMEKFKKLCQKIKKII